MPFTVLTLQPEDARTCVSIYFASFQNSHSLACWPREAPAVRKWWENMIVTELSEPGAHWLKAVATNGEIAGFTKWQEPKPGKVPDTHLPEWPEGADEKLCEETFGAWARGHAELMGDRGHWYLEMLATSPAFQGQGAGTQMMQYGLSRADAEGVEAYLEASPDAVRLYEKHGFREAQRLDSWIENERVKGTMYRNLFMIRRPQEKAVVS